VAQRKRRRPVRYYSPKRRKVYAEGDKIDALTLFELHAWICCICHEKINRFVRCPDWNAATIDHIIPISKGGTHTWDNVAPAHYRCNMDKADLTCEELNDLTLTG